MKIGIAGAGIMGRLLANAFADKNHEVSVFDQHDANKNCSMAAAGMLAPIAELEKCGEVIYQLGLESLNQHWPELLKEMDDVYFQRQGSLVVCHPRDQGEMTNFIAQIENKKIENKGLYQQLQTSELIKLEPGLSRFDQAYYLPDEGQLDNQACMQNLHQTLLKKNVKWFENKFVSSINDHQLIANDEIYNFDLSVDCRGLGAKSFTDLQAVRGELIWLHAPEVKLNRPVRLMHPRFHLYVAPRPDHVYLVGASEIYAEDYSEISVKTSLEILTAVYYLHPGFAEARIQKTVTHCRPALPDHLPRIKNKDANLAINGLYRHGYLIAPALAAEVMRWLEHGKSSLQYPQLWEFS